jgi:phosphate-selective porin
VTAVARAEVLALALAVAACASASAQSLTIGNAVRIDPKVRVQMDVRDADSSDDQEVDVDLARRRAGITGRVSRYVEFEVERDFDAGGRWRDAFVDVRAHRAVRVRAGHFKVPFSREQLTGAGNLDFIDRSRAADLLAPGRSAGVAVHGRAGGHALGYDAGAFVQDGTRSTGPSAPGREPTVAARLTITPAGGRRRKGWARSLDIGVAAAVSELSDGRSSLAGRLTSKALFFSPVLVTGRRLRVGGDLDWHPGPFGVQGEFLRADDARQHQGLLGETLPPLRARGWYLSGTWAVAGHKALAAANDGYAVRSLSGLQLTARVERLSFGTAGAAEDQVWTPRAAQLSRVSDRVVTLGVNWTLNRLVRIQANAVREAVDNRARGGTRPEPAWSPALRVQVAMDGAH